MLIVVIIDGRIITTNKNVELYAVKIWKRIIKQPHAMGMS